MENESKTALHFLSKIAAGDDSGLRELLGMSPMDKPTETADDLADTIAAKLMEKYSIGIFVASSHLETTAYFESEDRANLAAIIREVITNGS